MGAGGTKYETPADTQAAIASAMKPFATTDYVTSQIRPFATTDYVTSQIKPLASTDYVMSQIKPLASTDYVNSQMSQTQSSLKSWVTDQLKQALPTLTAAQIDDIAAKLVTNPTFVTNVSNSIAAQSATLSSSVASSLASNQNFNAALQATLITNPTLADQVAKVLTSNETYRQKLQGPQGTIGTGDVSFSGNVNIPGTLTADGNVVLNKIAKIPSTAGLEFGTDVPKEVNAGKMGYNWFGGTADRPHLAIVGAGKDGQSRKVKMWDEVNATGTLSIGDDAGSGKFYLNPGSDSWLRLFNKDGQHGDLGFAADNIVANKKLSFATGMSLDGAIMTHPGRMHISSGELLYLLPKNGVMIGKEWGGTGDLTAQGNIASGGVRPTIGGIPHTPAVLLRHKTSGACLNANDPGQPPFLDKTCDANNPKQLWMRDPNSGLLRNVQQGPTQCLWNGAGPAGQPYSMRNCDASDGGQRWGQERQNEGYSKIINGYNFCMDADTNSGAGGIWSCDGNRDNQNFFFQPL